MARVLLTALLAFSVCARELTHRDWDAATAGRPVFVKFFAPWCGHCKRMKPDWDQLMREYSGSQNLVVGDVDCTGAGQQLCQSFGVRGYPTIKYRAAGEQMLREYQGARDLGSLRQFVQSQQWLASTPQAPRGQQPQAPRQEQPQAAKQSYGATTTTTSAWYTVRYKQPEAPARPEQPQAAPRPEQPQAPRQEQPQAAKQSYGATTITTTSAWYTVRYKQPEAPACPEQPQAPAPAARQDPHSGQRKEEWRKNWETASKRGRREL